MIYYTPDHEERALLNLPSQYHRARILALVGALVEPVQEFEDACTDLRLSLSPLYATGHLLDLLGLLVGEQRLGLSDGDYRRIVQVKIAAMYSRGTRDELIDIYKRVTGADLVRYVDVYPAAFALIAYVPEIPSDALRARITRIIELAKGPGISFQASYNVIGGVNAVFNQPGRGFGATFAGAV